ncbi:ABC transporter permease [Aeromicrobium sp.]|uniref:ABC transporter permease n=1 Tax=Aeromicrobium sp. TaxID=1871063 RepID=UPI0010EAB4E1|nr:MAG: ABC transporter permease [Actinomycetales bacterium]
MTTTIQRVLYAVTLPVLLIAGWWFATANSTSFFWPPLSTIVDVFPETWFEGRFGADVVPSIVRLLVGYAIALVIGIAVGLAVGSSRVLRETAEPVLEFLRAIPPPVLVPVIMLFAGIGDGMKVSVIAFGCVWPILLNTVEGVRGVDEVLSDTARTYGLGTATRVRTLTLRAASPQIMAGARQALSVGIILMVISEMFAASNGLGFTTVQFQRSFAIPEMWTGIILLGLIGVVLATIFRLVERRVLSWYLGLRAAQRKG